MSIKKRFIPVMLLSSLLLAGLFANITPGFAQSSSGWSVPVNISDSGVATNPTAVVDSQGTLHVIWVDTVDGYRYSSSRDDGVTWAPPIRVNFPFDPLKDPAPTLVADGNGAIHVFWLRATGEFFYARATSENFSNPSAWATVLLNKSVANYSATSDSSSTIHLVYIVNVSDEQGFAGAYYRRSVEGRGTWSNALVLYRSEYFRATTPLTTYLRIAVSKDPAASQTVFATLDDRPQKRIFLASSIDGGATWGDAAQFKGPGDFGSAGAPFNFTVWTDAQRVLLLWQVGEPGASKCSVFSQASDNAGASWKDAMDVFGGPTACPTTTDFVFTDSGRVATLFKAPGDPVLIAWDGTRWSGPQSQINLPSLSNPDTLDPILLGCRQDLFHNDRLIVIGCDQTQGGDIWFLSRKLPAIETWYANSTSWGDPTVIEPEAQPISDMVSVTDAVGNIHAMWVETPLNPDDGKPYIKYSRWDGTTWSTPETVIRNLDGQPIQLALFLDRQERLLLTWIDGSKGDILFTWANLQQAGLSSGWESSTVLPSPSQLNSSPDIVADGAGRIIVSYAVEYNEGRGIYLVQSTDNGVTWSPFVKAFDGAANRWEFVDAPKIALAGDGSLHLLFNRRSTWASQPFGLYYSQSRDGGVTWTDAQPVSEGEIFWSDIVADGEQTVHRLWQESNNLVVANLSQVSTDGGQTWGRTQDITGVSDVPTQITLSAPGNGQLYFVQLLRQPDALLPGILNLRIQDSVWKDSSWTPELEYSLSVRGSLVPTSLTTGMSSRGFLSVLISNGYVDAKGEAQHQVLTLGRSLESFDGASGATLSAVVPVPVFETDPANATGPQITAVPTVDTSILYDSNDPSQGSTRNLVGAALIAGVTLILLFFLVRPRIRRGA